jgi:membrane protease YdiL (CAAX protease family)
MKKIIIYILITFTITWIIWGVLSLKVNDINNNSIVQLIVAGTMFIPLIGAFFTKLIFKKENIKFQLKPNIKKNIKFYLLAWFLPSVMTILGALIYFAIFKNFDISTPFFRGLLKDAISAGKITEDMIPMLLMSQTLSAVLIAPFINMIFAFGEEIGWRGFLLPALCEKYSNRKAIIISGLIWGLWHAPIIAMGHNYGLNYWGYPITGILAMCIFCITLGSFLSYLTLKTKSVWPAALGHGAINATAGLGVFFISSNSNVSSLLGPATPGLIGVLPCLLIGIICFIKSKELETEKN